MSVTLYRVFTIGHSNHPADAFLALLQQHGVDEVIDVRTSPYSRYATQFNHDVLSELLDRTGIGYVSLGGELGGRPSDRSCYDADGRVQYDRVAETDLFDDGIRTVIHRADGCQIALMCTEKDPLECHRTLLVARALAQRGVAVEHILSDGRLESHDSAMDRLMDSFKLPNNGDMFSSREDFVADAVVRQAKKMAYVGEKTPAQYDRSGAF